MLQQQETEPGNKRNLIAVINERVRCTYVSIILFISLNVYIFYVLSYVRQSYLYMHARYKVT